MKTTLILSIFLYLFQPQQKQGVNLSDFKILEGQKWSGTLTYLDYSSGKKTTIEAELIVEQKPGKNEFIFKNLYPKEPKANTESVVKLSKNGFKIDDEKVINRKIVNDRIEITTLKKKENSEYRYTYIISPVMLIMRKEEKKKGGEEFFERNAYEFTR